MTARTVIAGCAIATMDAAGAEYADGHLVIDGDRIVAAGAGPAPEAVARDAARTIDARGCLATPGLVNCHHHLYQWATRGLAQQATLFEWLTELYPVWAHIDDEIEWAAARAGLTALALSGCSTSTDHHYVFPETAEYARTRNVRLHTHMAETIEEEAFCQELFGCRPVEYLEQLGWLGDDVWLAHCVHLSDHEVARFGETRTGVAHCPSSNARLGAGIAPVVPLVRAGAPVGLGVDGAASNEAGELSGELRQALLVARLRGGPAAMTCAEALELGTLHGARCLGRDDELGTLEVGKLADIVLWRLDDLDHAGIDDPVAALVLGARPLAHTVIVDGKIVVDGGELRTGDVEEIARELAEMKL